MSTKGSLEDGLDVDNASYNPDACQAYAINGASANMDVAEMDHIVPNHIPPLQAAQPNRGKRRFFGIPKGNAPAYPNPDDYENKYPEDAYGEETGPSARVWRMYLDEALKADGELIEGWRDTTDVLLVFAGLFSAIVATFVVQTSTALQQDYTQVTASLLLETNSLLRAMVNQTLSGSVPSSPLDPASNFSSSTNDRWVNGLWFTSLSVSLVAAFMAVLVKQWIQHYHSVVFGTAQEQVQIRQFRFLGVERWQMPLIIGMLPMLLHLALFLYFAGLIVFLIPLDGPISYTTATIAGLAYSFYFLSTLLPLWYPMCPYKTPLSSLLAWFGLTLRVLISSLMAQSHKMLFQIRAHNKSSSHPSTTEELTEELPKGHSGLLHRLREAEKKAVTGIADDIDAQAFVWLCSTSSNPTVTSVTIQAVSGLRFDFKASAKNILRTAVISQENTIDYELMHSFFNSNRYHRYDELGNEALAKMERFLRACHQLESTLPSWALYQARTAFEKADEPRYVILNACLYMLSSDSSTQHSDGKNPITFLESYGYGNEGPQPVMWIALLKRSLRHSFCTMSECWAHAFKVFTNFYTDYPTYRELRLTMMLEYICSLSILGSDDERQQALPDGGWGAHSVLNGAPSCYIKVAPKIYSALSLMIDALRDNENISSCSNLNELPFALSSGLNYLAGAMTADALKQIGAEEKRHIEITASGLRTSIRKLVEQDVFWRDNAQSSRDLYCDLIFGHYLWPPSVFAARISWTQQLMDWLLRSSHIQSYWAPSRRDELYSYFSEGTPQIYRLFLEQDGLSKIERERHGDDFLQHYLDGLLHWKGNAADLDRQLDHLFQPENLRHVVQDYILEHDQDGHLHEPGHIQNLAPPFEIRVQGLPWDPEPAVAGLVTRLFKLRSPDQHPDSYGDYLGPLRDLQLKDLSSIHETPILVEAAADPECQISAPPRRGWLDGGRKLLECVRSTTKRGDNEEGQNRV